MVKVYQWDNQILQNPLAHKTVARIFFVLFPVQAIVTTLTVAIPLIASQLFVPMSDILVAIAIAVVIVIVSLGFLIATCVVYCYFSVWFLQLLNFIVGGRIPPTFYAVLSVVIIPVPGLLFALFGYASSTSKYWTMLLLVILPVLQVISYTITIRISRKNLADEVSYLVKFGIKSVLGIIVIVALGILIFQNVIGILIAELAITILLAYGLDFLIQRTLFSKPGNTF